MMDADNSWISEEQTNKLDTLKVAYQSGKWNNHLVPVIFPRDCLLSIRENDTSSLLQGNVEFHKRIVMCLQTQVNPLTTCMYGTIYNRDKEQTQNKHAVCMHGCAQG